MASWRLDMEERGFVVSQAGEAEVYEDFSCGMGCAAGTH